MSNARELAQFPNKAGRKNLLYNGACQVSQRGTSFTGITSQQYTLDRWSWQSSAAETVTVEQSTDHPYGTGNSLKVTITTADASLDAGDYATIVQRFEGRDLQHLYYGSSNAKALTLSFWVKSSETGDMTVLLYNNIAIRGVGAVITINASNTWEYKTVSFSGDQTGSITNDSANDFTVYFNVAAGSTYNGSALTDWGNYVSGNFAAGQTLNLIGTLNATFQLTEIQLEVGSVATEFEHLPFGEELARCQRYCVVYTNDVDAAETFATFGIGFSSGSTAVRWQPNVPVPLRAEAAISQTGSLQFFNQGVTLSSPAASRDGCSLTPAYNFTGSGSLTNGVAGAIRGNSDATAAITLDAEL